MTATGKVEAFQAAGEQWELYLLLLGIHSASRVADLPTDVLATLRGAA